MPLSMHLRDKRIGEGLKVGYRYGEDWILWGLCMVCRINDHFQERGLQITMSGKKKKKSITSSACL